MTWKYRTTDRKRLEKAVEACEEIYKRGYTPNTSVRARIALRALEDLMRIEGEETQRIRYFQDEFLP